MGKKQTGGVYGSENAGGLLKKNFNVEESKVSEGSNGNSK